MVAPVFAFVRHGPLFWSRDLLQGEGLHLQAKTGLFQPLSRVITARAELYLHEALSLSLLPPSLSLLPLPVSSLKTKQNFGGID